MSRRVPPVEPLDELCVPLAQIVAKTSWLPHPDTVEVLSGAVFPTVRDMRRRLHPIQNDQGEAVGMYDDNATPEWALFWAHGLSGSRPKGWTIAHVWQVSHNIASYTHLANLAMVPECFGSLTDKSGPLTRFLRWHAWAAYNWKPAEEVKPHRPEGYEQIPWRYLKKFNDPKDFIRARLSELNNQRVHILRPIMERIGML